MQEAARGPWSRSHPRVLLQLGSPRAAPSPTAPAAPAAPAAPPAPLSRPAAGLCSAQWQPLPHRHPQAATGAVLEAAVVPVFPGPVVAAAGAVGGKAQHGAAHPFLQALAPLACC